MNSNSTIGNRTDITPDARLLTGFCVFSAITVAFNGVLLIALKYTKAGKISILVFIRSLCVADLLIGSYGIFKTLLLQNVEKHEINCFLPDSVLVSASIAICLTLLWLNIDSYLRLTKPLSYGSTMDKGNVVIGMLLVWNASFILGFLPQLDVSVERTSCSFFHFYTVPYIVATHTIWLVCTSGSVVLQVLLVKILDKIQKDLEFMSQNTLLYQVYHQLVLMIRCDTVLLVICYFPFVIYIAVCFVRGQSHDTDDASSNIIFFLPVFISRSLLSAFNHCYRTIKLHSLTTDGRSILTDLLCRSSPSPPSSPTPHVSSSTSSSMQLHGSFRNMAVWGKGQRNHVGYTASNATIATVVSPMAETHESPRRGHRDSTATVSTCVGPTASTCSINSTNMSSSKKQFLQSHSRISTLTNQGQACSRCINGNINPVICMDDSSKRPFRDTPRLEQIRSSHSWGSASSSTKLFRKHMSNATSHEVGTRSIPHMVSSSANTREKHCRNALTTAAVCVAHVRNTVSDSVDTSRDINTTAESSEAHATNTIPTASASVVHTGYLQSENTTASTSIEDHSTNGLPTSVSSVAHGNIIIPTTSMGQAGSLQSEDCTTVTSSAEQFMVDQSTVTSSTEQLMVDQSTVTSSAEQFMVDQSTVTSSPERFMVDQSTLICGVKQTVFSTEFNKEDKCISTTVL